MPNRLVRIREWGPDLFGRAQNHWRVIRTSNAYVFRTGGQKSKLLMPRAFDPASPLHQALSRLGSEVKGEKCRA